MCKAQLANSTILYHPGDKAEICLMVDASELTDGTSEKIRRNL